MPYSDIHFGVLPVAFLAYVRAEQRTVSLITEDAIYIQIIVYSYFSQKKRRLAFSNSWQHNVTKYNTDTLKKHSVSKTNRVVMFMRLWLSVATVILTNIITLCGESTSF
jgi:hypothetical protein